MSTVIDLDNIEDIKLSDIVDSIKMVQLETTPECLIQGVSKTFIYNDRFYVFDSWQYVIFCFDKAGKFLFKIDNRGRGPKEYSNICDIELDKINNRLLLLEPWGNIYYFTLEGEFISKLKLPKEILAYNELFLVGGDTLLFSSVSDNLVLYSQKTNNILKKYPFEYGVEEYNLFEPEIFKNGKNIRFVDGATNDIKELDKKGDFIKIKSIDLGKYRINTNDVAKYEKEYEKVMKKVMSQQEKQPILKSFAKYGDKLPIYKLFYVSESERYFFAYFDSIVKEEILICITDKQLNKTKVVPSNIENISFIANMNGNSSDNIIILSDVHFFPDRNYYNPDLLDAKNKAIVEAHTNDMNPMLALYYLKK
jgi:hypothetical protein